MTNSPTSTPPASSSAEFDDFFHHHHHHHTHLQPSAAPALSSSSSSVSSTSSSSNLSLVSPYSSTSSLSSMSLISPAPTPGLDESKAASTGAFLTSLLDAPTPSTPAAGAAIAGPSFSSGDLSATLQSLNSAGPASKVPTPTAASTIADIRLEDVLPEVFCESRARIPLTTGGEIFLHVYRNNVDKKEHIAFVFGDKIRSKSLFAPRPNETEEDRMVRGAYDGTLFPGRQASKITDKTNNSSSKRKDTLVRIHSECYTGETAWSARCDCGEQLDEAARVMAQEGEGVIVYLRQEGRGIGLAEKLKAYNLQDLGADTVTANLMLRHPADARSFGLATAILLDLGQEQIRLMTNNPDKIHAVEGKHHEIRVTERVPMVPLSWQNKGGFESKEVNQYLKTKIERMGHMIQFAE